MLVSGEHPASFMRNTFVDASSLLYSFISTDFRGVFSLKDFRGELVFLLVGFGFLALNVQFRSTAEITQQC